MVLAGLSNAYSLFVFVKRCVRRILPKIMPLPVRSVVMVTVLAVPVLKVPKVMFRLGTLMLFARLTTFVLADLLTVRILNVVLVVPPMLASAAPLKLMVLAFWVKVPLLIQFPAMVCVKLLPSNVALLPIVRSPFIV